MKRSVRHLISAASICLMAVTSAWAGDMEDRFVDAAGKGDAATVQVLLDKGVGIDSADKDGNKALTLAAAMGQADVVKLLLKKHADVNATDRDGQTALAYVNSRIKKGKPQFELFDVFYTPLTPAEKATCEEIVHMLKAAGGSVYAGMTDDQLIAAAQNDDMNTVSALIAKGAHANAQNAKGSTALMSAAFNGNADMARLLMQKGARVDERDNTGTTALMLATVNGKAAMVKLLIEKGADVNARNKEGRSVMDHTEGLDCRNLLEAAGAK